MTNNYVVEVCVLHFVYLLYLYISIINLVSISDDKKYILSYKYKSSYDYCIYIRKNI